MSLPGCAPLDERLPWPGPQQHGRVYEALASGASRRQTALPAAQLLVRDEAGQFIAVTAGRALCRVHDARHYTKLVPLSWEYQARPTTCMALYWAFYAALLAYRTRPSPREAARLRAWFVGLFGTVTGHAALDERSWPTSGSCSWRSPSQGRPCTTTGANWGCAAGSANATSASARTPAGAKAWDSLHTPAATAQQHGVTFLHHLQDRLSGAHPLPSLAGRVAARAADLDLGRSWRVAASQTS